MTPESGTARRNPGTAGGPGPGARLPVPARRTTGRPPGVLYLRFHTAGGAEPGAETYQGLLALLTELTPVVEALPPDAALADVRGALRYFDRDAAGLAEIVRVRALARYGVDCTVGVAANPLLARMAAAAHLEHAGRSAGRGGGPAGAVRTVPDDPEAVAAFLARRPATALDGVGPATARALRAYGLDSVERIAAAPLPTLQRILGAAAGRRVQERARGIDPAPVTPNAPARSLAAEHRFDHDELDPGRRRRALLTLADGLGARLRAEGRVARTLTLTVRYADRSVTTRGRALPEPTAHTPVLVATAYALHTAFGLERARVRSLSLRAEGLADAGSAAHQLTFDPADDKARRIEAAADRARARFGAGAVRPAGHLRAA
ncbi:helix-hairpin-helix domain-containing protein [Streptomyces sp. NPDC018031]|uniref:DNA polymerase Y family protein n=1 Tax=Streptomyces sp. NPDC018031 TaxID=3365033 RepID=UPI00379ABF18